MNSLTTLFGVEYTEGNNYLRISKRDFIRYTNYLSGVKHAAVEYTDYVYICFPSAELAKDSADYLRDANKKRYVLNEKEKTYNTEQPTPYASSLADLVASETIHTNSKGGKQSYTPACFALLPPEAIATVAVVLGQGASKYGANNWRNINVQDHINHALQHLFSYLSCNNETDLSHAATRLLFALELYKVASNDLQQSTNQHSNNDATI